MFGAIIRQARLKVGLSQRQLGLLCGYTEASAEHTVQRWEYDQTDPPARVLRALAEALHLRIDQLVP